MNGAALDYPGRIKNIKEVENLSQFIEFVLPYGLAKIYMTANRRWSFLEKDRRKKAMALLLNRVIRRFAVNVWDIRTSGGGFMEDFHTMPVIGIIDILTSEYAKQSKLIQKDATFTMATFRLCGEGCIGSDLKSRIDRLHDLKMRREKGLAPIGKTDSRPFLYEEAVRTLYDLEECLIAHSSAQHRSEQRVTA